jgi:hypothetical protein
MAAYDFVAAALAGIAETEHLLTTSWLQLSQGSRRPSTCFLIRDLIPHMVARLLLTEAKSPGQRLAANVGGLPIDEPDVTLSHSSTSAAPR